LLWDKQVRCESEYAGKCRKEVMCPNAGLW
jgi:hypothetical protein